MMLMMVKREGWHFCLTDWHGRGYGMAFILQARKMIPPRYVFACFDSFFNNSCKFFDTIQTDDN